MGFVAAEWFAACVSQQGLKEVYEGHLEATPGSLAELLLLLAMLDFLTLSPVGGTATRRLTLTLRQGGARCVGHVLVEAIFGAPQVEAVRRTAVLRHFAGAAEEAKRQLLQLFQELPGEAQELEEAVELLRAAAVCLEEVGPRR